MAGHTEQVALEMRDVFQLLEDALENAGWTEIIMPTNDGLFTWKKGRFPNYIAIHQNDGMVVVYRDGNYARYTAEEWNAIKSNLSA